MIDPKLLTEKNGFMEGVWVEIDHGVMKWYGLELYDDDYIGWIVGEYENFDPASITSIRPLTGPMAIWNFAPEWANYLSETNDSIMWWATNPFCEEPKSTRWTRPFWTKVTP